MALAAKYGGAGVRNELNGAPANKGELTMTRLSKRAPTRRRELKKGYSAGALVAAAFGGAIVFGVLTSAVFARASISADTFRQLDLFGEVFEQVHENYVSEPEDAELIKGAIDGMLDVSIAGSGLVRTSRLDGPLTTRIAGSGAVSVKGGKADTLKATIDGSGGVYFEGAVGRADLRLFGSSEVQMGSLQRPLKHAGGGSVYIDGKLVEKD